MKLQSASQKTESRGFKQSVAPALFLQQDPGTQIPSFSSPAQRQQLQQIGIPRHEGFVLINPAAICISGCIISDVRAKSDIAAEKSGH